MKKNTFATMSTVITTVYKVTFILGTIAGFVLWIVWWRDYKKFLQKEQDDKRLDEEFPICNEVLTGEKLNPKWTKDEEYDFLRSGGGLSNDDELY